MNHTADLCLQCSPSLHQVACVTPAAPWIRAPTSAKAADPPLTDCTSVLDSKDQQTVITATVTTNCLMKIVVLDKLQYRF